MRQYHKLKNSSICPTVNVDQLWKIAGAEALAAAQANKDAGKAVLVDVTAAGFFKVLGNGKLPELPIVVKAREVSKKAEAKIKAAGGAVILTA
jgi:large subunit ribosomal protein L27Ae